MYPCLFIWMTGIRAKALAVGVCFLKYKTSEDKMFDLMRGVRMCLGWAGLVFMACSLSFFALGEQEGICVDCVKGDSDTA